MAIYHTHIGLDYDIFSNNFLKIKNPRPYGRGLSLYKLL